MPPSVSHAAVTMPRSSMRTVHASGGHEYRLLMAWPAEPAPPSGFPVIYVLDANATFGTFVEAIRMRSHRPDATGVGAAVVVGIAYPVDAPYQRTRRQADYTPPGSSGLRELLEHDIKPMVQAEQPIDGGRQTLFGHSLGGRFVIETLCASPASFDNYVAVSPSVWWERDQLCSAIDGLERAGAAALRGRRVMVTVGEYEQTLAPWQTGQANADATARRRRERRMVDDARALVARLGDICACVRFEAFEGEDHASVVPVSIGRALRFCLAPRAVNAGVFNESSS